MPDVAARDAADGWGLAREAEDDRRIPRARCVDSLVRSLHDLMLLPALGATAMSVLIPIECLCFWTKDADVPAVMWTWGLTLLGPLALAAIVRFGRRWERSETVRIAGREKVRDLRLAMSRHGYALSPDGLGVLEVTDAGVTRRDYPANGMIDVRLDDQGPDHVRLEVRTTIGHVEAAWLPRCADVEATCEGWRTAIRARPAPGTSYVVAPAPTAGLALEGPQ